MRNLKLTLAYDGTHLVGWQRQTEGDSVQGLLEDALARFEGAPVAVHGAGRTDAGVHALGQVASAQVSFSHDVATLTRALNAQLPEDVRVLAVEEVSPEFHARFKARSKTYRYQIRHGTIADPFERAYVWHMPEPLRVDAMRAATGVLIGTHDFAAFQSIGSPTRDSVRTITQSVLTDVDGRMAYRDLRRRLPSSHGAGDRRHSGRDWARISHARVNGVSVAGFCTRRRRPHGPSPGPLPGPCGLSLVVRKR